MKGFQYWSAYNNIAETLRVDAAPGRLAWGDPSSCGNSLAKASRDAKADPEQFVLAVRQLVATAGASATCTLSCADPSWHETTLGFEAKRVQDVLYVTRVDQETRLAPGMRIVAVGENKVADLVSGIGPDVFGGRGTDRESWDLTLRMFDDIDVFPGDGHVERLDLRRYPLSEKTSASSSAIEARLLRPDVELVRVGTLADPARLRTVLAEASEDISGARRLIVDLRGCEGDADPGALLALFPLLCDGDCLASDVMGAREVWTIYSKANVERLTSLLERARDRAPEQAREQAQAIIDGIRAKGDEVLAAKRATLDQQERRRLSEVVESMPSPFLDERVSVSAQATSDVVLLVDETCGVGAERLAQAVMGMRKVRLVGRATTGAADFDNYLTAEYPDVLSTFTYPISRSDACHEGRGIAATGLPLDVHVPFSPQECTSDAILQAALELEPSE